jgi:hypothetical protein
MMHVRRNTWNVHRCAVSLLLSLLPPRTIVSNIWEGPSECTLLNMARSEFTQPVYCFLPLFTGSQKISYMYKIDMDRGMDTNRARYRRYGHGQRQTGARVT